MHPVHPQCVYKSKWLRLIEPLVRLKSEYVYHARTTSSHFAFAVKPKQRRKPKPKPKSTCEYENQWELSGSKLKLIAIIWKYRSLLVGRNLKWSQIVVRHHPKNWKYLRLPCQCGNDWMHTQTQWECRARDHLATRIANWVVILLEFVVGVVDGGAWMFKLNRSL